MNSGIVKT